MRHSVSMSYVKFDPSLDELLCANFNINLREKNVFDILYDKLVLKRCMLSDLTLTVRVLISDVLFI